MIQYLNFQEGRKLILKLQMEISVSFFFSQKVHLFILYFLFLPDGPSQPGSSPDGTVSTPLSMQLLLLLPGTFSISVHHLEPSFHMYKMSQ
jgi:hypothetical protein